jgi:Holliday junction resolvasome RuvABC endonuclease subunit
MIQVILALDLGTKMGWAASSPDRPVLSGTISFQNGRYEGGGMRFLKFENFLKGMKEDLSGIDIVVYEEVRRHLSTDSAHVYGAFQGILTSWCEKNRIPYEAIPVGTIKKHATGKGNASKEQMIQAAQERGHLPKDDNEADAIMLLYTFINQNRLDIL